VPELAEPEPQSQPALFLILFLPLGISNGCVGVTLGYVLAHPGISVAAVAGLAALNAKTQGRWPQLFENSLSLKIGFSAGRAW
jgi:hypothetical protein